MTNLGMESTLGEWLDDPVGGPLLHRLLSTNPADASMLAPVRGLSLRTLVVKSEGALSREDAARMICEATGTMITAEDFDKAAASSVSTASLIEAMPHLACVATKDIAIPGPHGTVDARLYTPPTAARSVLVWIHGGGFVSGDLDDAEANWVALEVAASGIQVLSVDYRKATDGVTYPVPSDDIHAAWMWASQHLSGDGVRIHVGGASAGAALAAALVVRLREDGDRLPASVVLVYPVVHARLPEPESDAEREWRTGFTDEMVEEMSINFVGAADLFDDPKAFAGATLDFTGYPPTFILNAQWDSLRASGERLAAQLIADGVPVEMTVEPDTIHGYLSHPHSESARRSIERITAWLSSETH